MSPAEPTATWTVQQVLDWTRQFFVDRDIPSPRLDAEVLLSAALGWNRVRLYTHYDQPLSPAERQTIREWVKRRATREPVAHILGTKEFYGRSFAVTRDVLTPRPESEHLIDTALPWIRESGRARPRALDVGTGSGNLAVTLAAEIPELLVVATDVSGAALDVAQRNAEQHDVAERIQFRRGDLFAPVDGEPPFDLILSNPPYIDPDQAASLAPEVRQWEPAEALFAEQRGLSIINRLCNNAPKHLTSPGLFLCELGAGQSESVRALLEDLPGWSGVRFVPDLQGHLRVLVAERH